MANADTTSERTPLLHPQEDSLPQERASSNGRERHISDALSRIVSATSLDCLVPSDLLNLNAVPTGLSDPEASAEDYAYTLTALLAYREQQLAQITSATSKLDLYGQWTQDTSAEGDVKLLERHVDVVWGQFLSLYRTDREVDAVIWTSFRKDETSAVWLRVADFLAGASPYLTLLKHPLVEAVVLRRWKHGEKYTDNELSSDALQRIDALAGTPRNVHLVALISHFAYLYLLAHYLIYPPNRVSTDIWTIHRDISWSEIALVAFTVANLLYVGYPSNFLYCITLFALALPFPKNPQPGDGLFDILLLAFAIHIWSFHRPSTISPLFISNLSRTIPLSAFVHQSLTDGLAPSFFYFGPALIVVAVLLSISLEGGYLQALQLSVTSIIWTTPAPMETRNAFLTIALILILCLVFSVFATTVAVPSVRSAQTPTSTWDRFGTEIGNKSRALVVAVCSFHDGRYLYPPPLNLLHHVLVVPLEFLVEKAGWSSVWVKIVNVYLWRLSVLPFLLVALLVSKVL